MNNVINSSGIYDINSYKLTTYKATVLSTLNIGAYIIGSGTGLTNLTYGAPCGGREVYSAVTMIMIVIV